MKKYFLITCTIILILSNNITLHGMITSTKTGRSGKYRIPQQKKMIYPTKSYQKPILIDRLKSYYNQAKERISHFWYGKNYQQVKLSKRSALLDNIHENKSNAQDFFDMFVEKNNQKEVDQLLNTLIFSNHEINFLNDRTEKLFIKASAGYTDDIKIARKIINWAKENITRFFFLNEKTINQNFFLISLMYIDSELDAGLIPLIHDNLHNIKEAPSGPKFLALIKSQNPTIYNAVIQRKQKLKEILKEGVKKSLNEMRSRE